MILPCPCGEGVLLVVAPVFEVRLHSFLGWQWVRQHRVGFLVRCTHAGCAKDSIVGLRGTRSPDPRAIPGRGALPRPVQPPEANGTTPNPSDEEREPRGPSLPLGGAIRRLPA